MIGGEMHGNIVANLVKKLRLGNSIFTKSANGLMGFSTEKRLGLMSFSQFAFAGVYAPCHARHAVRAFV